MKKFILILLLISTPAWADDLGCFEDGNTVYATVQFNDSSGEFVATTVTARVFDPNDTTTPTATPTMSAVDGTNAIGLFRGSFTLSSPLAGTWTIRYRGSLDGGSNFLAGTDTFVVKASCPMPASIVKIVTASDNASAWNIKLNGTSYITTTGDYVGYYLNCLNTKREIIETISGASDYITVERGFPFLSAPVSETCTITRN
jgi:hypothetical protein